MNSNIKSISYCADVANVSTEFELENTDLKKKYLIKNIQTINEIMSSVHGFCGSFGTGYPFYSLGTNFSGNLPVIQEQIRYNKELIAESIKSINSEWHCASCLNENGSQMKDLKVICKPCPRVEKELKPRKVINRLPDIDMWMICRDNYVEDAERELIRLFDENEMYTSDVNPIKAIESVTEITKQLKSGIMPEKMLPLDIHIIEYSKMYELIQQVPFIILDSIEKDNTPYLPIQPHSLRKEWQYDDNAYNFILDYLYSLTSFNWDNNLQNKLDCSRKIISNFFGEKQLTHLLLDVAPGSVKRRFENEQLKECYKERVKSWKKESK